jgi:predicted enzyme related to lactoylglutathione lyase
MMVHGVAAVWVPVRDMDRAVAFYRDVLGLQVNDTQPEWSDLEANGLKIGLNAREEVAGSEGGAVITFQPEGGLDEAVEELRGQGVQFSGGISDHDWGRIAPFKDSEGNDLQLFEAPKG